MVKNPGIWPKIGVFWRKRAAGAKIYMIFGLLQQSKHSIFGQNISRSARCPNFFRTGTQNLEGWQRVLDVPGK